MVKALGPSVASLLVWANQIQVCLLTTSEAIRGIQGLVFEVLCQPAPVSEPESFDLSDSQPTTVSLCTGTISLLVVERSDKTNMILLNDYLSAHVRSPVGKKVLAK
jgi:hypothetical protein